MKHKQFDFRTAYIDLLLNVLTGIIFLFLLTTLMIQSKKEDEGIKKDAQYVIVAEWPADMDCDVDLWVQDPSGEAVWFNRRDFGIMHIERDDLGFRNDFVKDADGNIISEVNKNSETWVLRGVMPGEFYATVHLYSCRLSKLSFIALPLGTPVNVPVKVELVKLNPNYTVVTSEVVELRKIWQEQTAFNFTLDASGNVVSTDRTQHRLVKIQDGAFP
jgi:hypothetical protein